MPTGRREQRAVLRWMRAERVHIFVGRVVELCECARAHDIVDVDVAVLRAARQLIARVEHCRLDPIVAICVSVEAESARRTFETPPSLPPTH